MAIEGGETRFPWDPEHYHRHSQPQYEAAMNLLARCSLRGDERLLDIGCGDGRITAKISRKLPWGSILGIDPVSQMVDFAKKTFSQERYPNLRFEVGRAEALRFHEEFDFVVSFSALHWVRDQVTALKGICRALKGGGKFLTSLSNGRPISYDEAIDETRKQERWRRYFENYETPFTLFSQEDYTVLLKEAGFRPLRVETAPELVTLPNREAFIEWQLGCPPSFTSIPPELRRDYVSEFIDHLLEMNPPRGDGTITLACTRLEVEAEKISNQV